MNWKRQCFIIQQHKLYKHPHTAFQENSTISWSAAESHKQDRADWLVQIMFFGCKDTCINVHLWINCICFYYHSQGILDKHMLMKRFINHHQVVQLPSLDSPWPHAELSFRSTICSSLICWMHRPLYAICLPFLQTYSSKPEGVANCATEENVVPSGLLRLRFTELHFIGCIKLMLAGLESK